VLQLDLVTCLGYRLGNCALIILFRARAAARSSSPVALLATDPHAVASTAACTEPATAAATAPAVAAAATKAVRKGLFRLFGLLRDERLVNVTDSDVAMAVLRCSSVKASSILICVISLPRFCVAVT